MNADPHQLTQTWNARMYNDDGFLPREQVTEHEPAEIIYHIYPATFNDSNGDGHGDLEGIRQKQDYIAWLGVDTQWVSPFHPAPEGREGDGGYAVSDFRGIAPQFGNHADFNALINDSHDRDLRFYMDFVLCHTAYTHEWFRESRQDRTNPRADFYVWYDGVDVDGEIVPPTNWKSVFGGPAWSYDAQREQYYLHHFLNSQPALNLGNPEVQGAVLREMQFWLDKGVDGFRYDAVPFAFSKQERELRHNPWLDGQWPRDDERWSAQLLKESMCHPETVDLTQRIRAFLSRYDTRKTALGEVIAGPVGGEDSVPVASQYTNAGGLDMCYTNALMGIRAYPGQNHLKDMITYIESHFPKGGNCNAASNHDMMRAATRLTNGVDEEHEPAALRQMMQFIATLPGSLCIYQGEELGLRQAELFSEIGEDMVKDPTFWTQGSEECRDGSRTPMPWIHDGKHAGFSDGDTPYLPVPERHRACAVDAQLADPGSMLHFTRSILHWRQAQPALTRGVTHVLDTNEPVLAFVRRSRDQTLLCLYNISDQAQDNFNIGACLPPTLRDELDMNETDTVSLAAYGMETRGDHAYHLPENRPADNMRNALRA